MQITYKEIQITFEEVQITYKEMQITYKEMQITYKEIQITYKELQITCKELAEAPHNMSLLLPHESEASDKGCSLSVLIMSPERIARFAVLPRRLAPGCRLWQYFRAPERANSSRYNHTGST